MAVAGVVNGRCGGELLGRGFKRNVVSLVYFTLPVFIGLGLIYSISFLTRTPMFS